MNESAKKYYKKMFPNLVSKFPETDPEFYNFWHNFMYDEVVSSDDLDDRHRLMAILASCIAMHGINEFKSMIQAAYRLGVSPIEIKEIVYLAVPYCGIAQVLPFLVETNRFFESNNISLPLPSQSSQDSPLKKQEEIFGKKMIHCLSFQVDNNITKWINDNFFGDFYTRKALLTKDQEILAFCFLSALGTFKEQLILHIQANIRLGNTPDFLKKVISQCLPFIGYPRTLNTLQLLGEYINE